jgi:hypothetical protein
MEEDKPMPKMTTPSNPVPSDHENQINELYETVANGITILYAESEAGGDDLSINPARVRMLALSGFLSRNGVLQALNLYANYIDNPEFHS